MKHKSHLLGLSLRTELHSGPQSTSHGVVPSRRQDCVRLSIDDRGFTLVELLVVIAIIGILIALLLPAVQAAREAARRTQCTDNLKNMGLACQNYAAAKRTLPPGKTIQQTSATGVNEYSNWALEILPFAEEMALYRSYHFDLVNEDTTFNDRQPTDPKGPGPLCTDVALFDCPSDPNPPQLAIPGPTSLAAAGNKFAKGSYKGVAGRGLADNGGGNNNDFWDSGQLMIGGVDLVQTDKGPLPVVAFQTTSPPTANYNFIRNPVKIAQIIDGTSKTLLIGEYTTLTQPAPVGGVIISRSAFWGASYYGLNLGSITLTSAYRTGKSMSPMSAQFDPDYDQCNLVDMPKAQTTIGFTGRTDQPCNRAFTGVHGGLSGGVMNFVFCDGSVKAVSQLADVVIVSNLATIAGGEANQTLP